MAGDDRRGAWDALRDVGQRRQHPVTDLRSRLDARGGIQRPPLLDDPLSANASPLPVIPVDKAIVDNHPQPESIREWLHRLYCPAQGAGDDHLRLGGGERCGQRFSLAEPDRV